jgi:predicted dehydrogenase
MAIHYRVNAGYLDKKHWTQDPSIGGGRIIGEVCHFIDFLTYLVGSGPTSLVAQGLPDAGHYSSDNVVISCSFADGSLGTVSYLANGDRSVAKERVEVFCAGKVGILDDFRSLALAENGHQKSRKSSRQDKGHLAAWQAFLQAVTTGGAPPVPYEQVFAVSLATFAAMQSLNNNERVLIESIRQDKVAPHDGGS